MKKTLISILGLICLLPAFAAAEAATSACNLSVALADQKSVSTNQQKMLLAFSEAKGYNLVKLAAVELLTNDDGVAYGGIDEKSFKGQGVDVFLQVTPITWLTKRSTLFKTDTSVQVGLQNLRAERNLSVSSSRDVISSFANADHLIAEALEQLPACGQ